MKRVVALLMVVAVLLVGVGTAFAQRVDVGIVLPHKDEPRWLRVAL